MARFDAVIFDMDGTLIEPLLDFQAIRAELGILPEEGIIEAIEQMPPERATACRERLLEHEISAARRSRLLPDARETVDAIRAAGLKTGLLTRNAEAAMRCVLETHPLTLDLAWSREWGPIKPEPDGVLAACEALGVTPARTACVGDFRYDLLAANAAGAVSVLLARDGLPPFADLADHVIADLRELTDFLGL
jgi:HAD superfamily hydrolase (TIGR01509 family)